MFEAILEKILAKYLGNFIQGLDKSKLHLQVWKGDVQIENVNLKPDIVDYAELPIKLIQSNVGRLSLKASWSKLSSQPVEICLEDIFILIGPKSQQDWDFKDFSSVQKKIEMLGDYAKALQEKVNVVIEKQKQDTSQSYLGKMSAKIIDNIQLTIKNLHLRWECNEYSFGITLAQIEAATTDKNWVKAFIDRTQEKNKNEPMNKLIKLDSLSMYWNHAESYFIKDLEYDQENFGIYMKKMIYQKNCDLEQKIEDQNFLEKNQILNLNFEARLIQNKKEIINEALNDLQVELQNIDISLEHRQFQQLINLLDTFLTYKRMLQINRKKIVNIDFETQNQYKNQFINLFLTVLQNDAKILEALSEDQKLILEQIISNVNYDTLFQWVKQAVKEDMKNNQIRSVEKKKNKKGWFSKNAQNYQISNEEINEIENYIEETFKNNQGIEQSVTQNLRPPNAIDLVFNLSLDYGRINFSKIVGTKLEALQLNFENLYFIQTNQFSGEKVFNVALDDANIEGQTIKNYNPSYLPFIDQKLKNNDPNINTEKFIHKHNDKQSNQIISFQYQKFSVQNNKSKNGEDASVSLKVEPIQTIFSSELVGIVSSLFDLETKSENVKNNALQKFEQIQDMTEDNLKQSLGKCYKLLLKIQIGHQLIIIPSQNGKLFLDLGQFQLNTQENNNSQDSLYDFYKFKISYINFWYQSYQKQTKDMILKDYQIESNIQLLKTIENYEQLLDKYEYALIDTRLQDINLRLTEDIAKDIIELPNLLYPDNQSLEKLQYQKNRITENSFMMGKAKKLGEKIQQWNNCYVVFNGGYLYFYKSEKQLKFHQKLFIKGAKVIQYPENLQLEIKNERYDGCNLKFDNQKDMLQWYEILSEKLDYFESFHNQNNGLYEDESNENNSINQKQIFKKQNFSLSLPILNVELYQNNQKQLFNFNLYNLVVNRQTIGVRNTQIFIKLEELKVIDYVYNFNYQQYQPLVTSKMPQDVQSQDLLKMKIEIGETFNINSQFNKLYINWKPDSILKLKSLTNVLFGKKEFQEGDLELKTNKQKVISQIIDDLNQKITEQKEIEEELNSVKDKFSTLIEQKFNSNKVVFQLETSINQVQINLIHWQSHRGVAKLKINQIDCSLINKIEAIYCRGNIQDIQLLDITQYPKTKDSNQNIPADELEFIGRVGNQKESTLSFNYAMYDKQSLQNKEKIYSFLQLDVKNIFLIYQQQPIMRLIDYFLNQIMTLLTQSELLKINENYLAKKQQNQANQVEGPKQVYGEIQDIIEKFINPSFMDIRISLVNTNIQLKPFPQDKKYFNLGINNCNVNNQFVQKNDRYVENNSFQKNYSKPWIQQWVVQTQECQLTFIDMNQKINIANPFKLNIQIQQLQFFSELCHAFPGIKTVIDRRCIINGATTPLIIYIKRHEYLQLIKMIIHNFTYDDYQDEFYFHDYYIQKQLDPLPIDLTIDILQLKILIMTEEYNTPLAGINMGNLRINMIKGSNLDKDIKLYGETLDISHFQKIKSENLLIETTLVGNLEDKRSYRISDLLKNDEYENQKFKNFQEFSFYDFQKEHSQLRFQCLMKNDTQEKDLNLTFKEVKILAQTAFYINFGFQMMLEDWVWYALDNPFQKKPAFTFQFNTEETVIILPNEVQDSIFATRGNITFLFRRREMIQLQEKAQKGQINSVEDAYSYSLTLMNVELLRCSWQALKEVKNFNKVYKRSIVLPFVLNVTTKDELNIDQFDFRKITINRRNNISIEKFVVKLGYKDVVNFQNIMEFQQQQMKRVKWQNKGGQKQIEDPKQKVHSTDDDKDLIVAQENEIVQPVKNNQKQVTQSYQLNCEINGFQLDFINDVDNTCAPVFQVFLHTSTLQYIFNTYKSVFQACLSMECSYFNINLSLWEPFLEKCAINIDYFANEKANPQKYLVLELNNNYQAVNVNLSDQLIKLINITKNSWKKDIEYQKIQQEKIRRKKYQFKDEEQKSNLQLEEVSNSLQDGEDVKLMEFYDTQKETLLIKKSSSQFVIQNLDQSDDQDKQKYSGTDLTEYVSPYSIQNETGYDIEIQDPQNRKWILANKGSMNYRLMNDGDILNNLYMEDYERKSKNKIELTILHPSKVLQPPMGKVNLDTNKSREHTYRNNEGKVYLEAITSLTKKILLIRSNTKIVNNSEFKMEVLFFSNNKMSQLLEIEPFSYLYVPFDECRNKFSFRYAITDNATYSSLVDIVDLIMKGSNSPTNLYSIEMQHSLDHFSIIKIDKSQRMFENQIIIESGIKITNYTPFQINYELYSESNRQISHTGSLKRDQTFIPYNFSLQQHYINMRIKLPGFQKSNICQIHHPKQQTETPQKIDLCDYFGKKGFVDIAVHRSGAVKNVIIYVKTFIVNEAALDFYYFGSTQSSKQNEQVNDYQLVPGQRNTVNKYIQNIYEEEFAQEQKKISIFSGLKKLRLSFSEDIRFSSSPLYVSGIGHDLIYLVNPNDIDSASCYEFSVKVQTNCLNQEYNLFTKMITIYPRNIIVNQTEYDIFVMQYNNKSNISQVEPHSRLPYHWPDQNKPYQISVYLFNKDQMYGKSGPIDFERNLVSFTLRNKDDVKQVIFMKAEIIENNDQKFIVFNECKDNNAIYQIHNQLKDATINVYQTCYTTYDLKQQKKNEDFHFCIPEGQQKQFGWDYPGLGFDKDSQRDIVADIKFKDPLFQIHRLILNIDDIDFKREFVIKSKQDPRKVYKFCITISLEKNTKFIRFIDSQDMHQMGQEEEKIKLQLGLFINKIGISVISSQKAHPKRREIAYMQVDKIEFLCVETKTVRTVQFRCKKLEIDNNESVVTPFPKLLTNYKDLPKDVPFISFVLQQNISAQQMQMINSIRFSIVPIQVKLTDNQIQYFKDFIQSTNNQQNKSPSQEVYQIMEDYLWEKVELKSNNKLVYIKLIEIFPFKINVSFKSIGRSNENFIMNFTNAIGVSAKNVDEASVKINGIVMQHVQDTYNGIQTKLIGRYKENLTNQLFKIVGSANLIGNPIGLIKNIGSGMKDLIEMPAEGFVKGPIEGGVGLALGAKSLFKNTIKGTFNSVYGITNAVGTGLSSLTMDEKYIQERQKFNDKKADHALEGVGQGLYSFANGIGQGIAGIFTKPVQEAKKGGVEGFFSGVGKGLMGAVIKPVTGVVDMASKTAEGIKNTTTYFEAKKYNQMRARNPRCFYGREKYFKQYSGEDAEIQLLFNTMRHEKYANLNFLDKFLVNEREILVLTLEFIILMDLKNQKIIWDFETAYFYGCEEINDNQTYQNQAGVRIKLIPTEKQKNQFYFLRINEKKLRQVVIKRLNYLAEIEKYQQ